MADMAHYQEHNRGATRFIEGVLLFGVFVILVLCMAVYLLGLAWGFAP